jgi:hypothetical protein
MLLSEDGGFHAFYRSKGVHPEAPLNELKSLSDDLSISANSSIADNVHPIINDEASAHFLPVTQHDTSIPHLLVVSHHQFTPNSSDHTNEYLGLQNFKQEDISWLDCCQILFPH